MRHNSLFIFSFLAHCTQWLFVLAVKFLKDTSLGILFQDNNNCNMRPTCFWWPRLTCCWACYYNIFTNIMPFCAKVKKNQHKKKSHITVSKEWIFGIWEMYEIDIDERRHSQKWNILMINQRQIIPSLKNESMFKVFLYSLASEFCKTLNSHYWKWNYGKFFLHNFLTKWNMILKSM